MGVHSGFQEQSLGLKTAPATAACRVPLKPQGSGLDIRGYAVRSQPRLRRRYGYGHMLSGCKPRALGQSGGQGCAPAAAPAPHQALNWLQQSSGALLCDGGCLQNIACACGFLFLLFFQVKLKLTIQLV